MRAPDRQGIDCIRKPSAGLTDGLRRSTKAEPTAGKGALDVLSLRENLTVTEQDVLQMTQD